MQIFVKKEEDVNESQEMQKFAFNVDALKKEVATMTAELDPESIKSLMYIFSKAMRRSIQ